MTYGHINHIILLFCRKIAGKTNIIGAIDVLRAIIIRGSIKNSEEKNSLKAASAALELIPNNRLTKTSPVKFSITFLEKRLQIQYKISMNLGVFLDK